MYCNLKTNNRDRPPRSPRSGRPWKRRAILWFCGVFLAVQILVPLSLLARPGINPFGWQMFSGLAGNRFEVVTTDGSRRTIDLAEHAVRHRGDIDYGPYLADRLCTLVPDASEVVVSDLLAKTAQLSLIHISEPTRPY